jgi:signal peptidase I
MSQEKQLDEEILEKSQAVSSQEQASDEGLQESSTEEVSEDSIFSWNPVTLFSWFIKGLVACFGISVVALIVFKVALSPVLVSGNSMSPTMKDGQLWFSTVKQIRHPKKGDVVTAFDVLDHVYLVKRLVATEGDRVKPTEEGLYINGELIDSSEETKKLLHDSSTWVAFNQGEEVTLKKGEYFLVGDNLEHSNDSRRQGIYPEETIRTVVQFQAPNWLKTVLKVKTH